MNLLIIVGAILALTTLKAKAANQQANASLAVGAGILPVTSTLITRPENGASPWSGSSAAGTSTPNTGSLLVINPSGAPSGTSGGTNTGTTGAASGGATSGSTGGQVVTGSCFSGGVMIQTPTGYRDIDALPRNGVRFMIQNLTGAHEAIVSGVHEHNGPAIQIEGDKYVTPDHPMTQGGRWPASAYYEGRPIHHFVGSMFDISVVSEKEVDKHFVLWNGDVAHNKPICC